MDNMAMEKINLFQGDCFELLKKLPDSSIDLIVTDPPYKIGTTGGGSVSRVTGLIKALKELDDLNISNGYNIEQFGEEFLRVLKEPNLYFWCNKTQIPDYLKFYVEKHKCKFDILCWHKTNVPPTYSNKYLSDTEYLLYFRKGKGKLFPQSYEDAKTFYVTPINKKDKKEWGHPTIKPLDITEKIIRNSSREDDIILDPFMGSGTTGVACKLLNRKFIGMEIDKKYYEIAKERILSEMSNFFDKKERS